MAPAYNRVVELNKRGLMMKRLGLGTICVLLVCGVAGRPSVLRAEMITLGSQSLTDLLGASPQPLGSSVLQTDVTGDDFQAEFYSRAYTNDTETAYAYLYQIDNKITSSAPLEVFTVSPFQDADASVLVAGYLTGAVPAGFLPSPYQDPEDTGNVNLSGPIISFYFNSRFGYAIDPGEHCAVLYVMSDLPPTLITGYVIDGGVGSGPVVGPVPEPASAALLLLGLPALLRRRRPCRLSR